MAFAIFAVIALLIGFLIGKKYKWQYMTVKLVITALSAIIATFVSVLLASVAASIGVSIAGPMYEPLSLISSDVLKAITSIALAPIFFYPVFAVVRGLLNIAKKPLAKLLVRLTEKNAETKAETEAVAEAEAEITAEEKPSKKQEKKQRKLDKKKAILSGKFSPIGAALGAACGLMTFFIICIPIVCGVSTIAAPVASATASMDGNLQIVHNIASAASSNAATVTMKIVGGDAVYNRLTSYKVNGNKIVLGNELDFVSSCATAVVDASKTGEAYDGAATAQSLRVAGEDFKNTALLPTVIPEFLSAANEKWANGEKFMGVAKPSIDKNIDPLVDTLIDVLAAETFDTVKEDIPTIINVAADVSEKYHLSTLKNSPLTVLGDEEVSAKVFKGFLDNDRLYVMIPAISECGIHIISDKIAMHTDTDVIYAKMNAEMASEISAFIAENQLTVAASGEPSNDAPVNDDAEQLKKKLAAKLKKVFNNNGINITEESVLALSKNAILTFENADVSADSVQSWLSGNTITVVDLEGKEENVVLDSAQSFSKHTQIVDVDDIQIHKERVTDTQKEAALLAHSFKQIALMVDDLSGDNVDIDQMITKLGPVLDDFSASYTVGPDNTSLLLLGILQADKVNEKLKIPMTEAYDIGSHINTSAKSDSSYIELMSGLSKTVSVIEAAKGDDKEKTEAEVKVLLEDLTPASATTIQKISTPSLMESYGVSENSSEPTANLVSNVFGNLSDAKQDGELTDEQYEAESKAVSDMMSIAMNASSSSEKTIFGEGSATGITAAEFVDRVTDSTIVGSTLVETVYGDGDTPNYNPLNTGKQLSETEQTEMLEAINNKLESTPDENKDDLVKNLISAAAIVNLPVELTSTGFVIIAQQ